MSALRIGLKPWEYDQLTPQELNMMIESYNENVIYSQKENITAAFYGAYFQRVKNLGSSTLTNILDNLDKQPEMTDEQMLAALKRMCK